MAGNENFVLKIVSLETVLHGVSFAWTWSCTSMQRLTFTLSREALL